MEADQEPLDRERGHVHAPRLARSTKRKEMVEEIRCSFIAQGRNFKTTTSCSKQVAYKCDGCAFTFKLSVCQKQDSQEFGTWGLTKKALEQSWKVSAPSLFDCIVSYPPPYHRPLCIIAWRVMHSNEAIDCSNTFGKRRHYWFDQVLSKPGCSDEQCQHNCKLCPSERLFACLLHDCDDMLRVVWIMMRAAHLPLLLSNDEEIDHIVEMLVPPCTNECVTSRSSSSSSPIFAWLEGSLRGAR